MMRQFAVVAICLASMFPHYSSCAQPLSREDSLRILRWAQHAQWDFERHRRFALPPMYTSTGAPCDLIGRFCVRHGGIVFERIPAMDLSASRENLMHVLDTAATLLPGDDWIAGQRVRYLVDAGDRNSALRAARACRGTSWWCEALEGMALHVVGDFEGAEQAFAKALASMPAKKRCEWTDLSYLLDQALRSIYQRLSCQHRTAIERHLWLLADPLFLTPGNERWTEHLARHVWAESESGAVNTFAMRWGPDLEQMIVRFGWSEKWTQRPPTILETGPPVVSGHEHEPNYHFFPERDASRDVNAIDESLWDFKKNPPIEAYAPRYAREFVALQPQVARFRRGDSTLLVVAYDLTDDPLLAHRSFDGALAIVADDSSPPVIVRSGGSGQRAALLATTPARSAMLSVEALARDSVAAARWRAVMVRIELKERTLTLSDLLFFEPSGVLPSEANDAARTAYGGILRRDKKVGIYWEIYGQASPDSTLPVALTISPIPGNVLKRVIQALGIGDRLTPISIRWRENGSAGVRLSRSLLLDLSLIPPGLYEAKLEIGANGEARATRVFEIR